MSQRTFSRDYLVSISLAKRTTATALIWLSPLLRSTSPDLPTLVAKFDIYQLVIYIQLLFTSFPEREREREVNA
jgi:hypothetical protein